MKKVLIANWKMNLGLKPALSFAKKIKKDLVKNLQIVLAPTFPYLLPMAKELKNSQIKLAAQDIAAWDKGAYTGEVSGKMLKEVGCSQVIIGHSERRQYLHETDQLINAKIKQALASNLQPIICVGETLEEKKQGQRDTILVQQIKNDLSKIKNLCQRKIIIAYEPIWAIGTGQMVEPTDLEAAYRVIKNSVAKICSSMYFDSKVTFIYGGSIDSKSVEPFLLLPYLQGFLVGGASLDEPEFVKIAKLMT